MYAKDHSDICYLRVLTEIEIGPAVTEYVENSPILAKFTAYTVHTIIKHINPRAWKTGKNMMIGIVIIALLVSLTQPMASCILFLMNKNKSASSPPIP